MTIMSENEKLSLEAKEKGNEAYKKKDFAQAHQHYDKAIELDPNNITFLTNKAAVFLEEKKYDECISMCEKAVELGREHRADYSLIAKAFARIGNAYVQQGKLKEGLQYYDKSISEHRDRNVMATRGALQKKIQEEEKRAYMNPEVAEQEREKGNDAFRKGDYPEAMKHYNEAIKRNPEDCKLYSNRAACYTKLMEFPSAIGDCDHCIKLDPKFLKAYIRKGHALLAMHEPARAGAAFHGALEIDPTNAEAQNGYAEANRLSSKDDRSKVDKNDPEVQQILADPAMRMILEQMSTDPGAIKEHLQNPQIMQKIAKLIESGVVRMG